MRVPSYWLTSVLLVALVGCASGGSAGTAVPATPVAAAPAPAPAAAESDSTVLPAGVTAEMVERGRDLVENGSCIRCHGARGRGHTNGPSLRRGRWLQHAGTYQEIVVTITNGVPLRSVKGQGRRWPMNPRGGRMNLTDPQVRDIAAYVWSISRGKTR